MLYIDCSLPVDCIQLLKALVEARVENDHYRNPFLIFIQYSIGMLYLIVLYIPAVGQADGGHTDY